MKKTLLLFLSFFLLLAVMAQDRQEAAKKYFSAYLSSKRFHAHLLTLLPGMDDCRAVFSDEKSAVQYMDFVSQLREKLKAEQEINRDEKFADLRIDVFSTDDVKAGKSNHPGGMQKIQDRLKAGTVFYTVHLLREKDAAYGVAYPVFVWINGRWVFFQKPWKAFSR